MNKLKIFIALITFMAITQTAKAVDDLLDSADERFPYVVEIIGEDINVRSGPSTNHYRCGTVSSPQRLIVVDDKFNFSKIVPPAGYFSWISVDYVKKDSNDATLGVVSNDNVRVWAGSSMVLPVHSTQMQIKLNTGDPVKLMGEVKDGYYKIVPPAGAYLWVNTKWTKHIGMLKDFDPKTLQKIEDAPKVTLPPVKDPAQELKEKAEESQKALEAEKKKIEESTEKEAKDLEKEEKALPENDLTKVYKEYKDLAAKVIVELKKPLIEQDYTELHKSFEKIVKDPEAGKVAKYATIQLERIQRYEVARKAFLAIKKQDEDLAKARAKIKADLEKKLAQLPKDAEYVVIGKIKESAIYNNPTNRRYLIVDETNKIIAYAIPTESAKVVKLSDFFGKKIGLKGTVSADNASNVKLIRFHDIRLESEINPDK